jgi:hypothetical protein
MYIFSGFRGLFPLAEGGRGREANHSPPSSSEAHLHSTIGVQSVVVN